VKRALSLLLLLSLAGCVTGAGDGRDDVPEVMIDGLIVFNLGQAWVSAARILVPATGQYVSCGNIAPRGHCATGFPERKFSGNPVEVTWSEGGAIHSTGALRLEPPPAVVEAGRARVQVLLLGPGQAAAELVPTPGSG
jgi:hypothetical protein